MIIIIIITNLEFAPATVQASHPVVRLYIAPTSVALSRAVTLHPVMAHCLQMQTKQRCAISVEMTDVLGKDLSQWGKYLPSADGLYGLSQLGEVK